MVDQGKRERARKRLVLLLQLAERPGTPAEGEAAWGRIHALCARYGFSVRQRSGEPSFVPPRHERRSRRVWVAKGAGQTVMREDGAVHASDLTGEEYACEQCGRRVRRRREGRPGRFCSPSCRVKWNRLASRAY